MDAHRLRLGLTDYLEALRQQSAIMRDEGERLKTVWGHTREVYQGRGAEEFREAYERSARMQADYLAVLDQMIPVIEARLAALDQFDSPDSPQV